MDPSDELLAEHHVLIRGDNAFQRRARLRQALWREGKGIPIGVHKDRKLGSRIEMPYAKETLANYVTDPVRRIVRSEIAANAATQEKMYREPRIYEDLLSSQPLCFNLFGELRNDLGLASRTFAALLGDEGVRVLGIEFEYSPGRRDVRFSNDGSAFDVFVDYESGTGKRGFVGIEVKYVENLEAKTAQHRPRYDEVADQMACFLPEARARLMQAPLEQFWRDHLLAGSLIAHRESGFDRGMFALVYPSENTAVASGADAYRACLSDASTFTAWTLERVLNEIAAARGGEWVGEVRGRYLV